MIATNSYKFSWNSYPTCVPAAFCTIIPFNQAAALALILILILILIAQPLFALLSRSIRR